MSNAVEIGSLVGTWVAAGVAIVALIGILGPLLVWRTIRSERHKAIDKLSQRGAETAGYVSKGFQITSTIRLFRPFNAPDLQSAPSLDVPKVDWNNQIPLLTSNSASWIKFGRLLECYGFKYSKTNLLEVRGGQVWLPVHRIWIIIIGVVGRYGKRKDNGKLVTRSTGGIASTQARPGGHVKFVSTPIQGRGSRIGRTDTTNSDAFESHYHPLHGVTGTFQLRAPRSITDSYGSSWREVIFNSHTRSEMGSLPNDLIGIAELFWLAVGCLPASGPKVYSLDDVVLIRQEAPEHSEMPQYTSASPWVPDNEDEQSSEDEFDMRPRHRPHRHFPHHHSDSQYVVLATTTNIDFPYKDARAFQFNTTNTRVAELNEVANSIRIDDSAHVCSLEEVEPTIDLMERLKKAADATYVPADLPWVRFIGSSTRRSNWFLRREHAQTLAHALLSIPMSPLGYLVGGDNCSECRRLLCAASHSLFQLLMRLSRSLQALGITGHEATQLALLMETVYVETKNMKRTRPYYEAIHGLDAALAARLHPDPRVNSAIGVLMLTNEEFRDLIAQSARHIDESINSSIVLDSAHSTLNVPAVMGIIQRFPVELASLHPQLPRDDGPTTITFREVMFAALKACVRSTFSGTSLGSVPLFRTVLEMNPVVYIASSQQ